jgi:hypothetical protein
MNPSELWPDRKQNTVPECGKMLLLLEVLGGAMWDGGSQDPLKFKALPLNLSFLPFYFLTF